MLGLNPLLSSICTGTVEGGGDLEFWMGWRVWNQGEVQVSSTEGNFGATHIYI